MDAPRAQGLYPVAARDGGFRGYVWVRSRSGRLVYELSGRTFAQPMDVHVGFWWTRPIPPFDAPSSAQVGATQ